MSALPPPNSTTLGKYSVAHNPPTPPSDQHNRGIGFGFGFGSSPPATGSNEFSLQISLASLQNVVTTSDVSVMENPNIVPWTSDSPSSRNGVLHGSPHNLPTPHNIGDVRSGTSSHPTTGTVYLSPHASLMPGPIGHTSPVSWQYDITTLDTYSVVPAMTNSNTTWNAVLHGPSQSVPYLHDLEGARFEALSHPAMGRTHLFPHTSLTPIRHTLALTSSQCEMTALDMHSVVPMMANPNAISWTPGNFGTTVSHGPSQSVPYHLPDIGSVNVSFQHPSPQSELPIDQRSPLLCRWVHNGACCGYEGTLDDLRQHCLDRHLRVKNPKIKCQWERCSYQSRGNPSTDVMHRSSMWRHISEVHLMYRRNN